MNSNYFRLLQPVVGKFLKVVLLLFFLIVLPVSVPNVAAAEPDNGMPKMLRLGFLQRVFFDMDPRDAKAAVEVQGREISSALGLNTAPSVVIFPDMSTMTDAIRRGNLDMVSMSSIEFLRLRKKLSLIPSFVSASGSGHGFRYLVVTRKDSGLNSFSDLKGRSILLLSASRHELASLWLEVLLMKTSKLDKNSFFGQIKDSQKSSNGIMGVFFRQADAAIVMSSALETAQKLNPQLEAQLKVIAQSGNLSDGVACLLPSSSERFRRSLSEVVMQLNETPRGKQIFAMFQSNGVTRFKPEYLSGLEELILEHDRLKQNRAHRK